VPRHLGVAKSGSVHQSGAKRRPRQSRRPSAAKNTAFTLFVLQQPNDPFGVAWYQGDIDTNNKGHGKGRFIGIFSEEVFAIAPGSVPAPKVDAQDAQKNPKFKPVHTFHLGL
jgi:hypothetical protein